MVPWPVMRSAIAALVAARACQAQEDEGSCWPDSNNMCKDGTTTKTLECCGYGRCLIACMNCERGCRNSELPDSCSGAVEPTKLSKCILGRGEGDCNTDLAMIGYHGFQQGVVHAFDFGPSNITLTGIEINTRGQQYDLWWRDWGAKWRRWPSTPETSEGTGHQHRVESGYKSTQHIVVAFPDLGEGNDAEEVKITWYGCKDQLWLDPEFHPDNREKAARDRLKHFFQISLAGGASLVACVGVFLTCAWRRRTCCCLRLPGYQELRYDNIAPQASLIELPAYATPVPEGGAVYDVYQ